MRTVMMQLGPGMYSQRTGPCDECDGKGESIDQSKKCKTCSGKKLQKEKKKMKVEVDKGAPNGEKYTIHGEGDEIPDAEPGDVIVQIRQLPHKTFHRKGADLFIEKEIPLLEALTGVDFIITHLDGRKIRIKNTPGEIIKPDDIKTVEHMGMPFAKKTYTHGNLFIHFKLKFPTQVDAKTIGLITEALGTNGTTSGNNSRKNSGKSRKGSTEESKHADNLGPVDETVEMKTFHEDHKNTHHGGGTRGNDSEEEDDDDHHGHGGQKIGCQSQ